MTIALIISAITGGAAHADKARDARDAHQKALKGEVSKFFKAYARKTKRPVGELFQVINTACSAPANWYMNCEIVKTAHHKYTVWSFDYDSQKKKRQVLQLPDALK